MAEYLALSIVSPQGENIASGRKTLEVRSWQPPALPLHDLLIVEKPGI
ncbi:ASCH domain-containing protein [Pseudothauera nasutitermitis]|nr:ASCH domain-containing protein [Pseudothauera nasutitermitis]